MAKPKGHFYRLQAMQFGYDVTDSKKKKSKKKKKQKKETEDEAENKEEEEIDEEMVGENAKRARLLARDDVFYFFVGGMGAILAGLVFPVSCFLVAILHDNSNRILIRR